MDLAKIEREDSRLENTAKTSRADWVLGSETAEIAKLQVSCTQRLLFTTTGCKIELRLVREILSWEST